MKTALATPTMTTIAPRRSFFHASRMLLAASLVGSVLRARPQASHAAPPDAPREEARERFKRGVQLYGDGDFRAALIEFRRAYEVMPNYRLLFNLGQTSAQVQDHAAALRYFESYLSEGGTEVPAARRKDVEAEIEKLRVRVAQLRVKVNVDGAEVLVDDVAVGTSPLKDALLVSAGRRRITAQKSGLPAVTRSVDLAGGDKSDLVLELTDDKATPAPPKPAVAPAPTTLPPPAAPPVAPTPPPPAAPTSQSMGTPFWASLGATVVLAGGATVTGILAKSSQDKLDTKLAARGSSHGDIEDARSSTHTLALVTDILGGAAIVGAGFTTYLALSF